MLSKKFEAELGELEGLRKKTINLTFTRRKCYLEIDVNIDDLIGIKLRSNSGKKLTLSYKIPYKKSKNPFMKFKNLKKYRESIAPKFDKFVDDGCCDLKVFAKIGRAALNILFPLKKNFPGRPIGNKYKNSMKELRELFRMPQQITISGETDLFPWEFLYGGEIVEPSKGIEPTEFWGFLHEIHRNESAELPRLLCLPEQPAMRVVICPNLEPTLHDTTHPLRRQVAGWKMIQNVPDFQKTLEGFESDGLYFFGHAVTGKTPADCHILLAGEPFDVCWMEERGITLSSEDRKQLVFSMFNCCDGVPTGVLKENSVVRYLIRQAGGRLCCIATMGPMTPLFAASFSRRVFSSLLHDDLSQRQTVGQALLSARVAAFKEEKNALGLWYALFGHTDARFGPLPATTEGA